MHSGWTRNAGVAANSTPQRVLPEVFDTLSLTVIAGGLFFVWPFPTGPMTGDGLKRKWGRKHKHFESFDDILVDYLNSLPSDDARRESVTEVLNQRRRQRGKDSPAQP
jgi:hypothetical protein